MKLRLGALAALFLATIAANALVVVDFDTPTPPGNFPSYSQSGVTFTAVGGGLLSSTLYGPTPNGTFGLTSVNAVGVWPQIRADIAGGTSFVSVDMGDYNQDADLLELRAYNSADVLIGSSSLLIAGPFVGMMTLSVNVPGIAYVKYGSTVPSVGGSSVYTDNFTFDAGAVPIPEPGTLAMLSLGAVGLLRRRRK